MPFHEFQKCFWPQYINHLTRSSVLHTYRNLLRQISRFVDPLAKVQLQRLARDGFSTHKYVTDLQQIQALETLAQRDTRLVEDANKGTNKAMKEVLDRAFFSIGTKKSSLRKLIPGRTVDIDRSDPAYIFNNIPMPPTATFEEHRKSTPETSVLHNFMSILSSNRVATGIDGRKLPLTITEPFTVLGKRVALCRQHNLIQNAYSRIIRDAPKPVHMSVIEHIRRQLAKKLPRQYHRRLQDCMREYYALQSTEKGYTMVRVYHT